MNIKDNLLYVSYTGLLEPLGQSQVLAYLTRLSKSYNFTLVTYEKADDVSDIKRVELLKQLCKQHNIDWRPRIYHKTPRLLATSFDFLMMIKDIYKISKEKNVKIIHCRSYIPSIAAWIVSKITSVPFIFDMRALWLEEIIEAKSLVRSSMLHKSLDFLKGKLLKDAACIVSLTNAAVPYLKENYQLPDKKYFEVIPTCVDLEKFSKVSIEKNAIDSLNFGTMGTVISSRFRSDWLFKLFQCQFEQDKRTKFKIVSRDDSNQIKKLVNEYGLSDDDLVLTSSSSEEIAENIKDIDVSVVLFTPGKSTLGTSPTRIGEFLACGIPVIGNSGVGDTALLIEKYNVGVVLKSNSDSDIKECLNSIQSLLKDPNLKERCKSAAKEYFSADVGANKYKSIYQRVINGNITSI